MSPSLILLDAIPTIPEGITSEGLIAVLFMVIMGFVGLFFALKGGYLRLGKNGDSSTTTHKDEIAILLQAITANASAIQTMASEIRELKSAIVSEVQILNSNQRDIRTHIHDRITPTLAGLTIAYLKMADEGELAERIYQDVPNARVPRGKKT